MTSIVSQVSLPSSQYDDSRIQLTTSHYDRRTLIITRFQHVVAPHSNERHLSSVHPLLPSIYSVVSVGFKSSSQQEEV
jgi:hypothetical protein